METKILLRYLSSHISNIFSIEINTFNLHYKHLIANTFNWMKLAKQNQLNNFIICFYNSKTLIHAHLNANKVYFYFTLPVLYSNAFK